MAEAIQIVAGNSELRSRLRTLSLARSAEFSWEKTGKATANILKSHI
jgi:glycosyltransferase involved in cell wall biosynthesis